MAEVTNELIYEVLKNLPNRMSRVEDSLSEIRTELQAIRGHMLAHQTDLSNIYTVLARHDVRLEHIERPLDIVDEPTA